MRYHSQLTSVIFFMYVQQGLEADLAALVDKLQQYSKNVEIFERQWTTQGMDLVHSTLMRCMCLDDIFAQFLTCSLGLHH